ncbi:MAG TPA: LLM class flavin-dependent oxidoreductase [Candidatus Limnocylindrales bacterium]|nr:LLM class flavin-dependent oxidoreductase [Candidatus Limnocylindrales bacterium]
MSVRLGFKTSPQRVDWRTLDETWALAGELEVFSSGWLNDHLTDTDPDAPGPSFEGLTVLATLVHRVPGKEVGHAVLSNTFRHPVLVAKAAIALDHATDGRFLLGLGAGWFEAEHAPFGIPLPPIGERIDRLISAAETIRALFSPEATTPTGVHRPDPFYPLAGATNLPPPIRPGGPPLILGGQKRRGIELAARLGAGWVLPGVNAGDVAYFLARRDEVLRAIDAAGRDPTGFRFLGVVHVSDAPGSMRAGLEAARAMVRGGATDIIVGIPAAGGPDLLALAAREVAEPLLG